MKNASVWTISAIAGGVMFLALFALGKGPTELMALAAVLTAGAALVSSVTRK